MIAGAAAKRPGAVVALDLEDHKLDIARECGADVTLNIARDDVAGEVARLTEGYGADVYLEGTGHPAAVEQGLGLLRKQGRFVEYSVFKDDVSTDWSVISDDKELDVLGAHLGPRCWPDAIAMIESGRLPMKRICTHQLPLRDFEEGLELVRDGTQSIKVSLIPD
jgi:threonine dehydrogenase-like Zn-dependent dehydrogenase